MEREGLFSTIIIKIPTNRVTVFESSKRRSQEERSIKQAIEIIKRLLQEKSIRKCQKDERDETRSIFIK